MPLLTVWELCNAGLVLIFGLFLSVHIAGGWETMRQKRLVQLLCPVLLAVQGAVWFAWDARAVEWLYPLIVHLPLVLVLALGLKKRPGVSLVAVLTAYLCCQLPHWGELVLVEFTGSETAGALGYTLLLLGTYLLLRRFFAPHACAAIHDSRHALWLFGSLPLVYYLFDYTTTVYTDVLYIGFRTIYEFFPTVLTVFHVIFLTAYHVQLQKRTQAELSSSMFHAELRQSMSEMDALRRAALQTEVYRHDMRHHLNMIDQLIAVDDPRQAQQYIRSIREDIDAVLPRRLCENETVNLLCASYAARARQLGVELRLRVSAPGALPLPDNELCALLSNALENALNAAAAAEQEERWVEFYCGVKRNKLCIEVKNPYAGRVIMDGGLPRAARAGHGYGCRSIRTIAQQHGGLCDFEAGQGLFLLRVLIPMGGGRREN